MSEPIEVSEERQEVHFRLGGGDVLHVSIRDGEPRVHSDDQGLVIEVAGRNLVNITAD
jgi:hypothetical protein